MKITNIVWDVEDNGEVFSVGELGLPTELDIDDEIDIDDIADYLSDEYGWCVCGFETPEFDDGDD